MQQTSWAWFLIFEVRLNNWYSIWTFFEDRLKNSFRRLQNKRTHSITAFCSFTTYPQLQCWWLCSGRRRPSASERLFCSRLHSALSCSTLWKGQVGRATTYLETWTCAFILKTPVPKITRINKKQPANMTALMQMQRRYDTMFMCAHMHPCKRWGQFPGPLEKRCVQKHNSCMLWHSSRGRLSVLHGTKPSTFRR